MEIAELGGVLRARRTAAGRTIASVALEAGLSVPYIANLENGRGNPTLSAVSSLAAALGARLAVELADGDAGPPVPLPDSLLRFAKSARFAAQSARLAEAQSTRLAVTQSTRLAATESARLAATQSTRPAAVDHAAETATRERLLHAMAGMAALATRPLTDADWHRLLDAAVLMTL